VVFNGKVYTEDSRMPKAEAFAVKSERFVFVGGTTDGEERMKRSMAYRSFFDAGIRAAAGSDFSPGPFAPLMGIQGMVTRTGWNGETWGANQRISVDESLLAYD
jgi:predicted amidohydrolase YtcJ